MLYNNCHERGGQEISQELVVKTQHTTVTPLLELTLWNSSKSMKEPSCREVMEFGACLGLRTSYLNHCSHLSHWGTKTFWWEVLHEIGHFAVKDDAYLDYWWSYGAPGGVPNLNFAVWDSRAVPYPACSPSPTDITPDEYGVRAWCIQVLQVNTWIAPWNSPDWHAYTRKRKKNPIYQWSKSAVHTDDHFYGNGFDQLQAVGIDFEKGQFRPTVSSIIGVRPVVQVG